MTPLSLAEIAESIQGVLHGIAPAEMAHGISNDSRSIQAGDVYWALPGDRYDGHEFCRDALSRGAVCAVIEEGKLTDASIPCIRVKDTLVALGDLARAIRRNLQARVVGITGSVGKTSTKEFVRHAVSHLLKTHATQGNRNNLIGTPQTIFDIEPDDEWVILELGTDRPGEMKRLTEISQPQAGVLTTIAESHLERLGSLEGVFEEKRELLKGLPVDGLAVIPQSSPFRDRLIASTQASPVTFGVEQEADYFAVDLRLRNRGCYGFDLIAPCGRASVELQAPGIHQVHAAVAAAAVSIGSGLPMEGVVEGLQRYAGLPGRCEIVELRNGITLIGDHYNANPTSMAAAQELLETFEGRRKVFVVGEMWDLGEKSAELHESVGKKIARGNVDFLAAVGKATQRLAESAKKSGFPDQRIRWFEDIDIASLELICVLEPSDVVMVKGSRGMKMEIILESLIRHFGRKSLSGGDDVDSVC